MHQGWATPAGRRLQTLQADKLQIFADQISTCWLSHSNRTFWLCTSYPQAEKHYSFIQQLFKSKHFGTGGEICTGLAWKQILHLSHLQGATFLPCSTTYNLWVALPSAYHSSIPYLNNHWEQRTHASMMLVIVYLGANSRLEPRGYSGLCSGFM